MFVREYDGRLEHLSLYLGHQDPHDPMSGWLSRLNWLKGQMGWLESRLNEHVTMASVRLDLPTKHYPFGTPHPKGFTKSHSQGYWSGSLASGRSVAQNGRRTVTD